MKNEKPVATNNGLKNTRPNGLTNYMDNTTNETKLQFNSQASRQSLLDQSRLSRLPERTPFRLPDFDNAPTKPIVVSAVCAGCNARLDPDDTLQLKFSGCRKCISVYGRLDAAREENAKRETRELLEKFAAEVQR